MPTQPARPGCRCSEVECLQGNCSGEREAGGGESRCPRTVHKWGNVSGEASFSSANARHPTSGQPQLGPRLRGTGRHMTKHQPRSQGTQSPGPTQPLLLIILNLWHMCTHVCKTPSKALIGPGGFCYCSSIIPNVETEAQVKGPLQSHPGKRDSEHGSWSHQGHCSSSILLPWTFRKSPALIEVSHWTKEEELAVGCC